jgi:hypothetical protein
VQMCEATDRNRIVKAEGVEASWHMTAKPTGSTPTVNAALVPRAVRDPYLGRSAPHAVQADDDMTRIGSTGIPRPSAVASCPLRVEETGSNIVHKYSATLSNAGRDGAEVSRGHSRCPGVGAPKGQTMRHKEQT